MKRWWPAVGLFFLAPFVGEFLLGNQSIASFGWLFGFAPMYGGGAVLIRETARRAGLGWTGIVVLAVAYALLEEGPIDQMLFNPGYLGLDSFAGFGEIPGLGLSVTLIQGTITLHTIWSICVPIALIEACAPSGPWLGRRGLVTVATVFVAGSALLGVMQGIGFHFVASPAEFIGSAIVILGLIALAFVLGRRTTRPADGTVPRPLLVGLTGFAVTSTYWLEAVLFPDGLGSEWISVAWWFVLFGTGTTVVVRWARRQAWTPRHTLALATGALLTYCWSGFTQSRELDNTSTSVALLGSAVFAVVAVTIALIAWSRVRRVGEDLPPDPAQDPPGSERLGFETAASACRVSAGGRRFHTEGMEPVELTGSGLTPLDAVALGQRRTSVRLSDDARKRMHESARVVAEVAARRPVYGRTTGVGANRDVLTSDPEHGARLLASHSTTGTTSYPKDVVRLGLLIRVNQLAAGGSGLEPAVADTIVGLLNADDLPDLHRGGAIGTGDLGPLAELGLALGDVIDGTSALPLLSSNALTLAECCLAYVDASTLINVVPLVGALSHVALRGNAEVYDVRVHEARPQPGQLRVARRMRDLLEGLPLQPARVQDPFGLRAFAQVLGPAVDHSDALGNSVRIDINAAAENPLVAGDTVLHNGNWHAMPIALALDSLRLSLHSVATLSTGRVANLVDPDYTGLSRFLASGAETSSGVMMIEYVAHDALAAVRSSAQPATLGTATLSRGAELHASFAPQAAALTKQLLDALREVLASELVTAVRAIRLAGLQPVDLAPAAVAPWLTDALAALPGDLADRSLREDLEIARGLLTQWGDRQVEHPAESG